VRMFMTRFALAAATFALLAGTALPSLAAGLSSSDQAYLRRGIQEQLGRYALASAARSDKQNQTVRSLASHIATVSQAQAKHLQAIAKKAGIKTSNSAPLNVRMQYGAMATQKGKALASQFARALIIDDREGIYYAQREMSSGTDPTLKSIARKNLDAYRSEIKTLKPFLG
jgi:uncharacterized protein (DUF305 family)